MKKQILLLAFLLVHTFVFSQECGALMTPLSIQERTNEATNIVEGKIIASTSYWDVNKHNIYTLHDVSIYKNFKGQNNATFKIVTAGGSVGDHFQLTSSAANLRPGMVGVFFLKDFRKQLTVSNNLYELVGAAQGIIKYDNFTNEASDIFNTYTSIENQVYATIKNTTGNREQILQERLSTNTGMTMRANPIVYSFSPLTATAGTQTTLTITGNNFGASMGSIGFSNANDGGSSFTTALDSQILSWSNTEIQVEIPYLAGTGSIMITNSDNSTHTTSVPLTITYSHLNGTSGTVDYPSTLQDDNGSGGFTFEYHTDFDTSSAKTYFEDAFELWNCESGINFIFGNTTSTDESIEDGINIVRFDNGSELASGVLGEVITRYVGSCGTTGRAIADEIDITWNDSTNWYYGSGDPSASQYDFKTVALHELGHAHQLGHVIDTNLIMHYSLGAGENKYSLGTSDIDASVYTMGIFTQSPGCSITEMSSITLCCDDIAISSQPQDTTIAENSSGQFTISASGNDSVSWFSSTDGNSWTELSDDSVYSGTSTTTLSVTNVPVSYDGLLYRAYLENVCGESLNSDQATLTVTAYTSIPDANFEAALEALGYDDISGDGQVPTSLIESITSLNVENLNISDITGIEDFAALQELAIADNAITSLDLSNNLAIESIYAGNNQLTSINISNNTLLERLWVHESNLTSIDLSNNTALQVLSVSNNNLTSLDVSNNTAIYNLFASYNSLTSIDVSNNTALQQFHVISNSLTALDVTNNTSITNFQFHFNNLTEIDLSNNPALSFLSGRDNNLTSLDVSNNPVLAKIWCGNNVITSINITNNPLITVFQMAGNDLTYANLQNGNNINITGFSINNNDNLECITVDDAAYSTTNWTNVDATASFSEEEYCSYTTIPDANFEAALEALGYDDISGDGQVPTSLIESITSLNVDGESINDLTGIEDFVALETLRSESNSLTTVDVSNLSNLKQLYLQYNSLTSLDVTNNIYLETLSFGNNSVSSIDLSNNANLLSLGFQYNSITDIDLSNNLLLYHIACRDNGLTSLDLTNNPEMINIYAQNNAISVVDLSGNPDLAIVAFPNNDIVEFNIKNENNTNITTFNTNGNSSLECILVDDASYSSTNWTNIESTTSFTETDYCAYTAIPDTNFEAALEALNYDDISGDGQVPTALIEGVTNLSVDNEGITDLTGIEDFTALTELVISDNNIVILDVSSNTNLRRLEAFSCGLTSLDISQNTNLEELIVYSNALTTLDTSNNTSLTNVTLFANQLTSLDFSSNTALTYVEVSDNELTELNIQNGTNNLIQTFDATNNSNLSCIRVDDAANSTMNWTIDLNTSFSETYCRYTAIPDTNFETRLESIITDDVSGDGQVPTVLIEVITNLNLSNRSIADLTGIEDFTALQKLNASTNTLTSVDLTNNTNLEELNISDNTNLTSLDVSSCVLLERINVEDNAFSTLDLSANTQLDALFVTDNDALTEIDLSTNSLLRVLTLDNLDNIASVDISQNATIDSLQVTNNVILSEFNVKNGANTDIFFFQGNNNSSLTCILVDDASYSTASWSAIDSQASFSDTYCRYTAIPDANFETALEALITDDVSGDGQVPTAEIEVVTSLDVRNLNIADLTGIEDFVALEALYCSDNSLTTLNVSNLTNLQTLWAVSNNLTSIDLTNNPAITDIRIENNELTSIDLSNQTNLVILQIDRNELTAIDVSNSPSITRFRVYDNNISNIDLANNTSLSEVRVQNNRLLSLNLQNGNNTNIGTFAADNNEFLDCILVDDASYSTANWTTIDAQTSFSDTTCTVAYTAIPDSNFEAQLESLGYDDISGDGQVPTAYIEGVTTLDVGNLSIADLTGIEDFIGLVDLDAEVNNLTSLDLSNNTLLETIDIDSNDLSSLTLPTNGSLITFSCNNNSNLTTVDFSGNTNLQTIQCINNGLTSINLTGLSVLTSLGLNENSLSSIDISDAMSLETLTIGNNALTSINLSNNTNLTYLTVESNNLNSLDISNNTALEYLILSENNITSIDTSSHTALVWLYAGNNQLTTIDVSANTLLERLWVNDNQLTSLDVSSNLLLEELVCYNNSITSLDASGNSFLSWFLVNNNALTSVNLQNGNNTNILIYASNDNPDLSCMLVDDASYSTTNWTSVDAATTFNESACTTEFTLGVNVYLQGALLNPNTGEESLMRDDLRVAGYIPTTSPYADALTCEATVFDTTGNDAIVDWILIEFRDATDNTIVTYSQSALLQRDGDVVDVDGISDIAFSFEGEAEYCLGLQHRNHLGIMTSSSITFVNNALMTINFTDATNQFTYGTDAQTDNGMPTDIVAMWCGDVNSDSIIQYSGTDPDVPAILSEILNDSGNFLNFPTYAITGYNTNDIDMNGTIQYSGTDPDTPFVLQNVLAHPSNFLSFSTYQIIEQLP
ncbi:internalin-J [Kordia sp. SMS9]|uniref:matrixin family metalloprotease n=1 Tax=Kordia sp. SMS9 TaxID=2282170 RepID=UPI000E0DFBAE|nr:matrixin family metalloprotease [Kordia sp. SMS9]AXG71976.1 internalin-J [Kordia sp. SMS9]